MAVALALAALLGLRPAGALAADPNPPATNAASYRLDATLDPAAKQVRGSGRISYRNPSQDALGEVWLRLYLNAFRSPNTQWMREAGGSFRGFSASEPGWIRVERLALAESGVELPLPGGGDSDDTIVRVALPRPLTPGGTLDLDVRWTAQLPRVFARTGYAGSFFLAGQWYPKLAVYDRGRWDTEPWHANAEFFADFGAYDLAITVPSEYTTGASGVREGEAANADGTKTVRYRAERVTDVAWTAWPEFRVVASEVDAAGARIQVELLLPPSEVGQAERHLAAARAALDAFGTWYGAYPWPKLTVVVPPAGAEGAGGMEYPTFVATSAALELPFNLQGGVRDVEVVSVHEIAHQWFPMQVQSNEAAEPWLDEGFADYLAIRLLSRLYGPQASLASTFAGRLSYAEAQRSAFATAALRQPLAQPAWRFPSFQAYGATAYAKGSLSLLTLERTLGEARFTAALRRYADRWRWRHPTSADLFASLEEATGEQLDWFFDAFVLGDRVVDYRVAELDGTRAVVERTGDAAFPVDVRVTGVDGASRTERWDGAGGRLALDGGGPPIREVSVDPDRQLALEPNRLDNSRAQQVDLAAPLAVANRWLALVQGLLQLAGLVG